MNPYSEIFQQNARRKKGYLRFTALVFSLLLLCLLFYSCDDDKRNDYLTPENSWTSTENARDYCIEICSDSDLKYSESAGANLFSVSLKRASADVPRILVVGGIHGNEQLSVYITLKMIERAAEESDFGTGLEIVFYPVMNPHGLDANERYTKNGVDLNRNFPFTWQHTDVSGETPLSEVESQHIAAEADYLYSLLISFHTGAFCISTLWDYAGTRNSGGTPQSYTLEEFISLYCPAYSLIKQSGDSYAQLVQKAGGAGFTSIEGFDWYPVYGSIGDWYYYNYGTVAHTIELDMRQGVSDLSSSQLERVWGYHKEALSSLITVCEGGIHIQPTAAIKAGTKVLAEKISRVQSEPKDPLPFTPFSFVRESGYCHILVPAGEYTLTYIDPDDESQSYGSASAL